MARSALTQLQGQIEAIRREAYAAGYAAAMQVIQKAVSAAPAGATARPRAPAAKPAAKPAPAARPVAAAKPAAVAKPAGAAKPARGRPARAPARKAASRPRRGNNAAMIEDILKAIAPRAARPAEIRTALQRDKGASVAFTSIRHALGQLEARQAIEQVGDSKTWRLKG